MGVVEITAQDALEKSRSVRQAEAERVAALLRADRLERHTDRFYRRDTPERYEHGRPSEEIAARAARVYSFRRSQLGRGNLDSAGEVALNRIADAFNALVADVLVRGCQYDRIAVSGGADWPTRLIAAVQDYRSWQAVCRTRGLDPSVVVEIAVEDFSMLAAAQRCGFSRHQAEARFWPALRLYVELFLSSGRQR